MSSLARPTELPRYRGPMKLALAVVGLLSCGSSADRAAVDHYKVKGRITAISDKQVEIYSERIAAFRGESGKVAQMNAMAMPYGIGRAKLGGLAVGDADESGFDVGYNATPSLQLTELVNLPPGVVLVDVPSPGI